jgi:hypothetical protein
MNLNDVIPYSFGLIGSFVLVVCPFTPKYRHAPISIRLLWFLAAPFMFGWSAIGFFLAFHKNGTHTNLSWQQFWVLDHLKAHFAGACVALLLAFMINPEYWQWWWSAIAHQGLSHPGDSSASTMEEPRRNSQ